MALLLSSAYLPPVSYLAALLQEGGAEIEIFENFQKQSYRNRCQIYGPNGKQNLSIPIEKPADLMKDVRISYSENWPQVHAKSLEAAYRNTPFFEVLGNDLLSIILRKHNFLIDLNQILLNLILSWLQAHVQLVNTTAFTHKKENAIDLRDIIHPKKMSILHNPRSYYQIFGSRYGFLPDLSVVDLIFHEGPLAWDYLMLHKLNFSSFRSS